MNVIESLRRGSPIERVAAFLLQLRSSWSSIISPLTDAARAPGCEPGTVAGFRIFARDLRDTLADLDSTLAEFEAVLAEHPIDPITDLLNPKGNA